MNRSSTPNMVFERNLFLFGEYWRIHGSVYFFVAALLSIERLFIQFWIKLKLGMKVVDLGNRKSQSSGSVQKSLFILN